MNRIYMKYNPKEKIQSQANAINLSIDTTRNIKKMIRIDPQ